MNLKLAIGIAAFTLAALPNRVAAQDHDKNTDISTHTATGCLRAGVARNDYALTDEDGKTWELQSQTVSLRPHVGHTVIVTGTIPTDPPPDPKNTADAATQNRLVVSKVDTVRSDCKQP